jgi:hypothetical protein
MRLALALAFALALPACASNRYEGGGEKDWYAYSPTGTKEYYREGGYAAVGVAQGFENFDTGGTGLSAGDSDPGFALRGGYRFQKEFAVELSIENLTGFELEAGNNSVDLDFWHYVVQGKYYFMTERFQPYALVGLGQSTGDVDSLGIDGDGGLIRLGVGTDFYINKDVGLFAEIHYNRLTGDLKDLDHTTALLGVIVRF